MIIDINIHPKSFPLRLFLMFKYLSKDVKEKRLSRLYFISQWIQAIEKIKDYPDYSKVFWDTVDYKTLNLSGDMDSVVEGFVNLK